ncbi:hypothetical protein FACS1894160_2990 [Bacteroidia bacterium]|nr:hypothetical protein FACS1894160_2990 [Bacteroidia bacterium]
MSDNIEIKKSENQLIIGRVPSWIAQWGNLVISGVFLLLVYISFHVTFPDIIQGQVSVSEDKVYIVIPDIKQESIRPDLEISLRMDDYPYMDYGILQGRISEDILEKDRAIWIQVFLEDDKNKIKRSELLPGMRGTGEIIVERIPIIYRIIKVKKH